MLTVLLTVAANTWDWITNQTSLVIGAVLGVFGAGYGSGAALERFKKDQKYVDYQLCTRIHEAQKTQNELLTSSVQQIHAAVIRVEQDIKELKKQSCPLLGVDSKLQPSGCKQ